MLEQCTLFSFRGEIIHKKNTIVFSCFYFNLNISNLNIFYKLALYLRLVKNLLRETAYMLPFRKKMESRTILREC